MYDFGGNFDTLDQIRQAADSYINGWYNNSGSCPKLNVVIGTNNDNECAEHGSTCNTTDFGTQLGNMLSDVINDSASYSGQVTVMVGDDAETGYDSYNTTVGVINGFSNNNTYSSNFIDYGDAASSSGWSDYDIFQAAYALSYDYPLAQAYLSGQINRWITVGCNEYTISFLGTLTDYPFDSHNSPATGYTNFYNALQNAPNCHGQSLAYASNI